MAASPRRNGNSVGHHLIRDAHDPDAHEATPGRDTASRRSASLSSICRLLRVLLLDEGEQRLLGQRLFQHHGGTELPAPAGSVALMASRSSAPPAVAAALGAVAAAAPGRSSRGMWWSSSRQASVLRSPAREELVGGVEVDDPESRGFQQETQRITHRRVVVHDPYQPAAPVLHAALHAVRPGNSGDRPSMS